MTAAAKRWQRALFALCALAACTVVFDFLEPSIWPRGDLGIHTVEMGHPFVRRVLTTTPGGDADRAGIKPGDVIDLRVATPDDRLHYTRGRVIGTQATYRVVRDGVARDVHVTFTGTYSDRIVWVLLGVFAVVCLCALIVWRRPDALPARLLVGSLCTWAIAMTTIGWITPWPSVDVIVGILPMIFFPITGILSLIYVSIFARPLSRLRTALLICGIIAWLSWMAHLVAVPAGVWFGTYFETPAPYAAKAMSWHMYLTTLATTVFTPMAAILAILATRGKDRSLLVWTTSPSIVANVIQLAVLIIGRTSGVDGNVPVREFLSQAADVVSALAPLTIGYALLTRRLLDVAFVINRAIVFAVVSAIMVAAFVLVEWALSEWLVTQSHTENILIAGGLALALGLSMRFVHHHIDNVVDRVLFAKRRAAQDAIAAFAIEAPYITNRNVLLERTHEELARNADASHVHILLHEGSHYGRVDENDRAIVAMRARHDILDLHDTNTALHGDYAFPMVSRGRLLGVITVGHKNSGETYAPDELAVIKRMAHSVASALDLLGTESKADPILERLDALYAAVTALSR